MNLFSSLLLTLVISAPALAVGENPNVHPIKPGEARWITFPAPKEGSKLKCRDQEVKFAKSGETATAVIIESYFSEIKPFTCKVEHDGKTLQELAFNVVEKEFKAERLKVDPKKIKLSPHDENRAAVEQLVLNKIYASSVSEFLFDKAFIQPLNSALTSIYGTKRVYNKEKKGQHLGVDFRAPIGEKVPSTNKGKVVYAGDLFYTGWTVIIDHGMDIFTVYGHLSKTLVEAGKSVERGEIIGLSGNTGRSSGPHLHWGVKIQGQYVDGMALVDETKRIFTE